MKRSPPRRNHVTTVPKRPPASPHSLRRPRSPRRQRAEAKPRIVTAPKNTTNTMRAVQLIGMLFVLGHEIGQRGQQRADDDAEKLKPVEEREAPQARLDPVIKRHPHGERDQDQQQPQAPDPAPLPAGFALRRFRHPLPRNQYLVAPGVT